MKTYTTKDGAQFQADSHSEFLRLMRKDSWDPRDSDLAFREATARAASLQTGQTVSDDSDEILVEGLLAAGLIWISEEEEGASND